MKWMNGNKPQTHAPRKTIGEDLYYNSIWDTFGGFILNVDVSRHHLQNWVIDYGLFSFIHLFYVNIFILSVDMCGIPVFPGIESTGLWLNDLRPYTRFIQS